MRTDIDSRVNEAEVCRSMGLHGDALDIYEKILSNQLSVRETEYLVRNYNISKDATVSKKPQDNLPEHIKEGIQDFSKYFGHKIDVKLSKNGKGKIVIPFYSEEDFNRIKKLIQGAK